jgi:hypothetical protein
LSDWLPICSNPLITSTQYSPWCHGKSFFGLDFDRQPLGDDGGSDGREDGGEEYASLSDCSGKVDAELSGKEGDGEDGVSRSMAYRDREGGDK